MRFKGKVCLITGAGSGIGRATSNRFASEGACVVVVDLDKDAAAETVRAITDAGGCAVAQPADVSCSADVRRAVNATVEKFGKIDVLINNAAVMSYDRVLDLDEDEWDRVIAVNLRSVFLLCKYSLPHMKHGAIVNVSSVHAHETDAGSAPYATSKGGLEAFSRALSREYQPSQIRVNCVAPGGVDTPMLWSNPAIKAMDRKDVLYSEPEQIAEVICFLASEEAATINGTTVVADMGLLSAL